MRVMTASRAVSALRRWPTRPIRLSAIACVFGALCTLAPHARAAYTDPGTGALLWQTLMAAAVGFSFYIRRFIQRLLRRNHGSRDDADGR